MVAVSVTPTLPASGMGTTRAVTTRLTAGRPVDVLDDGEGVGDEVALVLVLALPDADADGVGSDVGPADELAAGGSPRVGVAVTSTMCGVGAPCAPTTEPADADAAGPGRCVPGVNGGEAAIAGSAVNCAASAIAPAAAALTAHQAAVSECAFRYRSALSGSD
jgi:hypothetical protein